MMCVHDERCLDVLMDLKKSQNSKQIKIKKDTVRREKECKWNKNNNDIHNFFQSEFVDMDIFGCCNVHPLRVYHHEEYGICGGANQQQHQKQQFSLVSSNGNKNKR